MLLSSPEQEIKWRLAGATPTFIGEAAYYNPGVFSGQDLSSTILLGSFKFESVSGIHFNPRAHRCSKSDALDVLTLCP